LSAQSIGHVRRIVDFQQALLRDHRRSQQNQQRLRHFDSDNMRLYVPPERWNEQQDYDKLETYYPRRAFVLAPCNLCGIPECGNENDAHGTPIVIAISGLKHRATSACGIFCNINSPCTKTVLLHQPNCSVSQAELNAAVIALQQVKAFLTTEGTEEAVAQTRQIIIKTDSIYITADKETRSQLMKCKHLAREFNELLSEIDDFHHSKLSVRFWKVSSERNRMAQQLAEAKLAGHEETRDIRRLLYSRLERAGWYDPVEE
jgi:ribonuclease HI